MNSITNWRNLLIAAMEECGETMDMIISNTMTDEQMDREFDAGYGAEEGIAFTVWTEKTVYFPLCYDGSEWVGSVSRNPDGKPTEHQGGG